MTLRLTWDARRSRVAACVVLVIAAIGVLWLAAPAGAYRPASRAQRAAITRVVHAEWRSEATIPCPIGGPSNFHLDWAYLSTIDPRYALTMIEDSGCTYTTGYFLQRPSAESNRWRVVARRLDSAQDCSYFTRRVPRPVLREFSIEGVSGPPDHQGGLTLCVTPDTRDALDSAPVMAGRALTTTAPLNATGPEDPEGGVVGLVHPRHFMLAVVPFSFGFTTSDARWHAWGSSTTIGTGEAEFNVIMTAPEHVSYRLILSKRRLISCGDAGEHYSYEKVVVIIPDYNGVREDFGERMHTGCSHLANPLA